MRQPLLTITLLLCLISCGCAKQAEEAVVEIDNIRLTKRDILHAYNSYRAASPQNWNMDFKTFLNQYISMKVVLREAERQGFDRDPQFLDTMQYYWEQALLDFMLKKRGQQHPEVARITDPEVEEYYRVNREAFFKGMEFDEVKPRIQEFLFKEKQRQEMQVWEHELRRKTKMRINFIELGIW